MEERKRKMQGKKSGEKRKREGVLWRRAKEERKDRNIRRRWKGE